ncbi:RNA-directed DNA polymerase (reversetranscriptase)-related family protein [Striga asiatica]|uniref:RNA-directed DNA polymerase (Reversetranscriptase)-related family protein n=1 Tax=Striga asiatica TaxID=4170 RepID=A0A5A7QGR0_STRAF|nr:RNA-directed DNA polymerase (reversetranscriptase)-related family protein [Striga asiatica]
MIDGKHLGNKGKISVKSAYEDIMQHINGRKANLRSKGLELDNVCSLCGEGEEDVNHLFIYCPRVRICWKLVGIQWESFNQENTDIQAWWEENRNEECFKGESFDELTVVHGAKRDWLEMLYILLLKKVKFRGVATLHGDSLKEWQKTWDWNGTENEACFLAVRWMLDLASKEGWKKMVYFIESKAAVQKLSGEGHVPNSCSVIFDDIVSLQQHFEDCVFKCSKACVSAEVCCVLSSVVGSTSVKVVLDVGAVLASILKFFQRKGPCNRHYLTANVFELERAMKLLGSSLVDPFVACQ